MIVLMRILVSYGSGLFFGSFYYFSIVYFLFHSKFLTSDRRSLNFFLFQIGSKEVVEILLDNGADVNSRDELGYTALSIAAIQGKSDQYGTVFRKCF